MSSRGASLEIRNVDLSFGGIAAIKGVSFEARASELLAMVGPNGAGKTAMLNCINGIYRPDAGEILLDGRNIPGSRCTRWSSSASGVRSSTPSSFPISP